MVDFVGALQAASLGLSALKELSQVNKAYDEALLKLKIADLTNALMTVQFTLGDAQKEIREKDAEIAKLRENFRRKNEETIEHNGFLYRRNSDGKPLGLPFCPRCLEKGTMMMIVSIINNKLGRIRQCPECKSEYHEVTDF